MTPDAPPARGGYLDVLRVPGAAAFCAAATLARLPMAMGGLGLLLLLTGTGRSFSLAGLVSGVTALGPAVGSPYLGRLTDRLGQTRVLVPQVAANAALLLGLVVTARAHGPAWLLVGAGAAAGMTMPQFGALSRARWTVLLGDDPRLETALALEAVIEEGVFVAGPVLVAGTVAAAGPSGGLLLAAAVTVTGCALFVAQRRTEPVPRPGPAGGGRHPGALRSPGLVVLVAAFTAMGAAFGFVEVGVVGLADRAGRADLSGLVLGIWTTGSLVAGVVYGARAWRSPAPRRFVWAAAGIAVSGAAVTVAAAVSSGTAGLVAVSAVLLLTGTSNAPTIITGNAVVPDVTPPEVTTEAYTWLNVTIFAGAAAGTAVGGAVVDRGGPVGSLACAAVAGALTAGIAFLGRRRLVSQVPPTAPQR